MPHDSTRGDAGVTSARQPRVGVVGAGMAGLLAARDLEARDLSCVLFDKARGPGGRMATRREAGLAFDHGAQYFTVRDERFGGLVASWRSAGVVAAWSPRLVTVTGAGIEPRETEHARFVGTPRMSALTRHLAEGLPVRPGRRVRAVERHGDRAWRLAFEDGETAGPFEAVIVTAPPEQAAALVAGVAEDLAGRAASCASQACWAVMVAFAQDLELAFDAAFVETGPLAWVARDASKPGRAPEPTWVLHGSRAWSEAHATLEAPEAARRLLEAFIASCGIERPPPVRHLRAHLWRLAMAAEPLDAGCLADETGTLVLAGDWCAGCRVEGAALSGLAAAEAIRGRLA